MVLCTRRDSKSLIPAGILNTREYYISAIWRNTDTQFTICVISERRFTPCEQRYFKDEDRSYTTGNNWPARRRI